MYTLCTATCVIQHHEVLLCVGYLSAIVLEKRHNPLLQSVWYAQLGSDILPVAHTPETSQYQVTLSGPHNALPGGKYTFNFFGESVIGEVRKVCGRCLGVASSGTVSSYCFGAHTCITCMCVSMSYM